MLPKDMSFATLSDASSPPFWRAILDSLALEAAFVVPEVEDKARHDCPVDFVNLDEKTRQEYDRLRAHCWTFFMSDTACSLLQSLAFSNANATGEATPSAKAKANWTLVQQTAASLATLHSCRFIKDYEAFLAFRKAIRLSSLVPPRQLLHKAAKDHPPASPQRSPTRMRSPLKEATSKGVFVSPLKATQAADACQPTPPRERAWRPDRPGMASGTGRGQGGTVL